MPFFPNDLGGEVLRGATDRHSELFTWPNSFRESEVSEFEVTAFIKQDILWFEAT
jgi:hypothetical protein